MIRLIFFLILPLMALTLSCYAAEPAGSPAAQNPAKPSAQESIGSATMQADGSIVLQLRAEGNGAKGDAVFVYRRDNPQYESILKHVGPIKPGESKLVRPWPDTKKP